MIYKVADWAKSEKNVVLRRYKSYIESVGFAVPYLIIFSIFLLYPLLKGLYISFHEWNLLFPAESKFVLIENYSRMLDDPLFWKSLRATLYFVVLVAPMKIVVSLLLALGVHRVSRDKVLQLVFFSPYILPVSVAMLIWREIYSPSYGPLNYYLSFVVESVPSFLNSFTFAMPAIAVASAWWTMGFNFVILLAARQNVPEQLYEAARIDGAKSWHMLRDITLPQMRPAILFVVIIQFIGSFRVFGQPFILTDGGPGNSTLTLVMYIYQLAFQYQEYGYAAAIGYVLFGILVIVSVINFKIIQE